MSLMIRRNKVRETRMVKGLSAYDLQLITHIPAQTIYGIERGLRGPLQFQKDLIADALGLQESELFPPEMARSSEVVECDLVNLEGVECAPRLGRGIGRR